MKNSWRAPLVIAACATAIFAALMNWAHWGTWPAWAASAVFVIVVRTAHDMRPRRVPAELAGALAELEACGWRLLRRHPYLCTDEAPHVHVIKSPGPAVVLSTASGCVVTLSCHHVFMSGHPFQAGAMVMCTEPPCDDLREVMMAYPAAEHVQAQR